MKFYLGILFFLFTFNANAIRFNNAVFSTFLSSLGGGCYATYKDFFSSKKDTDDTCNNILLYGGSAALAVAPFVFWRVPKVRYLRAHRVWQKANDCKVIQAKSYNKLQFFSWVHYNYPAKINAKVQALFEIKGHYLRLMASSNFLVKASKDAASSDELNLIHSLDGKVQKTCSDLRFKIKYLEESDEYCLWKYSNKRQQSLLPVSKWTLRKKLSANN
jgi:hypothetical protein